MRPVLSWFRIRFEAESARHLPDGSISDALLQWKANVDKVFEGVEECPICYMIVHASTGHLPKLECKTCHNKFHSACLYKWFSQSQKSTCPLCQSAF